MSRKLPFALILLLAAVLAGRLFFLYRDLGRRPLRPKRDIGCQTVALQRPRVVLKKEYRNLFGVSAPTVVAGSQVSAARAGTDTTLNELVSGRTVLRVKGIFIAGERRVAVLTLIDRQAKKEKITEKKVEIGDHVATLKIVTIQANIVTLAEADGSRRQLKIFNRVSP